MDEAVRWPTTSACWPSMMDPADRAMLGNVPQALSHLALVNAAAAIDRATA